MPTICLFDDLSSPRLSARYSALAHQQLVQSAADSNINTLRVWGGGVYLPQVWYDACDELGILVFHDMVRGSVSSSLALVPQAL